MYFPWHFTDRKERVSKTHGKEGFVSVVLCCLPGETICLSLWETIRLNHEKKKKKKVSNDPKVSTAKSSGHVWVIPADSPLSFHHTKSQFNLMFMHLLCKKHQGPRCESQNHRLATVCVASSHPHSRAQIRNFEYLTESGVLYNPNSFIMNKLLFSVRPYSLQVYFFTSSVLL